MLITNIMFDFQSFYLRKKKERVIEKKGFPLWYSQQFKITLENIGLDTSFNK